MNRPAPTEALRICAMSLPTPSPEPEPKREEPPLPGPLSPYWFVIVCGGLMLGLAGFYVAVRYEHWMPLKVDTKVEHAKSTF
jgi:hypothetical protein